ncbi:hypothetical protein D9758_000101 [Tetrapyrgos nigripes]|uniref:Protein kinase domain-containing protein n=1 Tax=Tetrapyrgos nigripes TaxID=182062 RepID=A0A8H5H1S9_9AGAR|nr:hypothetical protein D9758_000101 [Tetrapyrgos nigripes]
MVEVESSQGRGAALDAIRISDNKPVQLKVVDRLVDSDELRVGLYFSSEETIANPRNHCVPIYDVLAVPGKEQDIIVMPLLRPFSKPDFDTVGEVLDFIRQIFEGIQFMHEHHTAHRDISDLNIMMDGDSLYPEGWHPILPEFPREFSPTTKLYAKRTGIRDVLARWPTLDYLRGGDRSPPEHDRTHKAANPFPTDIYFLGNLICRTWTKSKNATTQRRFAFLTPLVNDMVQKDPIKRPTIDEVCLRFDELWRRQPTYTFRAAPYGLGYTPATFNPEASHASSSLTTKPIVLY